MDYYGLITEFYCGLLSFTADYLVLLWINGHNVPVHLLVHGYQCLLSLLFHPVCVVCGVCEMCVRCVWDVWGV